jgi:hypothetical protein
MNEELKKYLLEKMKDGVARFDTWGGTKGKELYKLLKDEKLIDIDGTIFTVSHTNRGGMGMGAYPNSITVTQVDPSKATKV